MRLTKRLVGKGITFSLLGDLGVHLEFEKCQCQCQRSILQFINIYQEEIWRSFLKGEGGHYVN